jgi:flavodoxin I
MKTLIIYDSQFGNTEKIARAVGEGLSGEIEVSHINQTNILKLSTYDLIIVGSPTQGGRPTAAMQHFLDPILPEVMGHTKVAAFDTRFSEKDSNFALKLLMKTIGYAAPKIAKTLESKGGQLVVSPEGFIVQGKKGPLKEGELARAVTWGKSLNI